MNNLVIDVYITSGENQNHNNIQELKKAFSAPIFNVSAVNIIYPETENGSHNEKLSMPDKIDTYKILWALRNTQGRNPERSTIVIKDDSVANDTSIEIEKSIRTLINKSKAHITYLFSYNDRCDLLFDDQYINSKSKLYRTRAPNGLQALFFTKEGREIMLGHKNMIDGRKFDIWDGKLSDHLKEETLPGWITVGRFVPNLINFDLSKATSSEDYKKMNLCATKFNLKKKPILKSKAIGDDELNAKQNGEVDGPVNPPRTTTGIDPIWYLLIIFVIVAIIVVLTHSRGRKLNS